LVGNLLQKQL